MHMQIFIFVLHNKTILNIEVFKCNININILMGEHAKIL